MTSFLCLSRSFSIRIRKKWLLILVPILLVHLLVILPYDKAVRDNLSEENGDLLNASKLDLKDRVGPPASLAQIGQHIFNAYFDTRLTLGGRQYVRVISVLDRQAYNNTLYCQFVYQSGKPSYRMMARKSKIGFGIQFGKHHYQEFLLSCQVVDSLQSAAYLYVETAQVPRVRSRLIKVRHNPMSRGERPEGRHLIINCVSLTFGKPSEHRLVEWLEAQRLLKMSRVQMHFYHLLNKQFEETAQHYNVNNGFLKVTYMECPFCESPHEDSLGLLLMSPAINQCFYENLGRYKFTTAFDLDEIIVPQRHADYASMLSDLEIGGANADSFVFRNWYHFEELGADPLAAPDEKLYMLRHPFRTKQPSPAGYSAKSIHRSDSNVALHNHYSWEQVKNRGKLRFQNYDVPLSDGVLEHYKKCHFSRDLCQSLTRTVDRQNGSRLNQLIDRELVEAFQQRMMLSSLNSNATV